MKNNNKSTRRKTKNKEAKSSLQNFTFMNNSRYFFLILAFIFAFHNNSIGQISNTSQEYIESEFYHSEIEELIIENPPVPFQSENVQTIPNVSSGYVLDSIIELTSLGMHKKSYRWYFACNNSGQLKSCERKHYNAKGEYENVFENLTYNSNRKLTKLTKTNFQSETPHIIYREDYTYKNQLLTTYAKYDSENSSNSDTSWYHYNLENKLKYRVYTVGGSSTYVDKYIYELTDSSKTTKIKHHFFFDKSIILDSISDWLSECHEHYEKFDHLGRTIEFTNTQINTDWNDVVVQYKIYYTYNENNQLSHISYYNYFETIDVHMTETARISFTYNEQGNLKQCIKRYYNAHTETWEIENQKDYYYSPFIVGITESERSELKLFPNPTSIYLNVTNNELNNQPYIIYNLKGQTIGQGKLENQQINVSKLSKGHYIIKVNNLKNQYSGSFLKD